MLTWRKDFAPPSLPKGNTGLTVAWRIFAGAVPVGPEALALLIRCGALDFTGRARPALFLEADLENLVSGTAELFAALVPDWQPTDYSERRRLLEEWQLLGFVVGPPLLSLFASRLPADRVDSQNLHRHIGRRMRIVGLAAAGRTAQTEDGRTVHFFTLDDGHGLIDVSLFEGSRLPVGSLSLGPYQAFGLVEQWHGVIALRADRLELLAMP